MRSVCRINQDTTVNIGDMFMIIRTSHEDKSNAQKHLFLCVPFFVKEETEKRSRFSWKFDKIAIKSIDWNYFRDEDVERFSKNCFRHIYSVYFIDKFSTGYLLN